MTVKEKNIKKSENFFARGCKDSALRQIGVEIEHFLTDNQTGEALPFSGEKSVQAVLKDFIVKDPDLTGIREDGVLLGAESKTYALSLEPGAQLEISIAPCASLACIKQIYHAFLTQLSAVLREMDASYVCLGYHPKSRAQEIALIPKQRYRVMDAYFSAIGPCGRQMMRATASTQVSVDYSSEADFRRKYHAACVLTPVFQSFADNTPVYEGKKNTRALKRNQIWRNVDPKRCGLIPCALKKDLTFLDYANYLYRLPLVYCPETLLPAGKNLSAAVFTLSTEQIWEKEEMTDEAVLYVLSMAFPDVRLKNYIEIRCADALPEKRMLSYVALVKGLLYHPDVLSAIEDAVQKEKVTAKDILLAQESLVKENRCYGMPKEELIARLSKLAADNLPKEERQYLQTESGGKENEDRRTN